MAENIGKEIGAALLGLGQGAANYINTTDKMLENEQRQQKIKKEKELEEFTDSTVGAMKALYTVESAMADPNFQGDATTLVKGFIDYYNKDVPNGRRYTGAMVARGQDGTPRLMLTEQDDSTGKTRIIPADLRKLNQGVSRTYGFKTGKNLMDMADKYEHQMQLERQRNDNRHGILQARLDARESRGSGKQEDVQFLIKAGVPQEEAIRRVFGHETKDPRDYTDKQHRETYASLLTAYSKAGFDPDEAHQKALAGADEYIASRQTKPAAPGTTPQVVQAPAGQDPNVGLAQPQPHAAQAAGPGQAARTKSPRGKIVPTVDETQAYLAKAGGDKVAAAKMMDADGFETLKFAATPQ